MDYGQLNFYIIILVLIWLFVSFINIRLSHKSLFDWWEQNNGKEYDNKFNMFTAVSSTDNTILYYLSKLSGGVLNKLNINQIRFIIKRLFPSMRFVQNGEQFGILTPKILAESALLSPEDGDDKFNIWWQNNATRQGKPVKIGTTLIYNPVKKTDSSNSNLTYFTYEVVPDKDGYVGLYPSSNDTNGWAGLISDWLGDEWVFAVDKDDGLIKPYLLREIDNPLNKWFNIDQPDGIGNPDNFLSRMRIKHDSALVVYFINNKFSDQTMKVDAQAFKNLIGEKDTEVAGGWVGYLNGLSDKDTDELYNMIDTSVYSNFPDAPICNKSNNTRNGLLSAGISLVSSLSMLAFINPATAGPAIIMFVTGLALTGAGLQYRQSTKDKC